MCKIVPTSEILAGDRYLLKFQNPSNFAEHLFQKLQESEKAFQALNEAHRRRSHWSQKQFQNEMALFSFLNR